MREIMMGRATSPPPATAPSTQVSPEASKASAKRDTAAASPPEVHQCMTSSSTAAMGVPTSAVPARRQVASLMNASSQTTKSL
jgi:hypothetical protein